jgi:hypothetical protein
MRSPIWVLVIATAIGYPKALDAAVMGVPSAATSYVAPRLVSCPAGDSTFFVVSRHLSGDPWSEGFVTVHFCGCPGYHLSLAGSHPYTINPDQCSISMLPDAEGASRFPIAGGGICPGDTVWVDAGHVLLQPFQVVASLDQNGDLRVESADLALVYSKLGTHDLSADFDGDGLVTTADVQILRAHLGHAAPDAATPAVLASWGELKIRYR